ncbi:MAG: hypothetical protein JW827_04745 [Spirochaetes bacterium]|nr:hypothetical protein [Spirochaetota bacterium]
MIGVRVCNTDDLTSNASNVIEAQCNNLNADASTSNNGYTFTFTNILFNPCYAGAFFDGNGTGMSNGPDSGDPLEAYNNQVANNGDPININQGHTVNITITFDDTMIVP